MIYFLAHSDWILYNSRKEIATHLNELDYSINAITTEEAYKEDLKKYFNNFYKWDVDRNKLIDLKGIINLRKILKQLTENDILHIYTLKSGLYVLFASHFMKKKYRVVLSITGLGYLFSKNNGSKVLRNILRFYMKYFFNRNIDVLIFQNHKDEKVLKNYLNYKNQTFLIKGSGLNLPSFSLKNYEDSRDKEIKIIMCCRLLKDKGIEEYFKLTQLFDNNKYKFYLAGNVDPGNPSSYSQRDIVNLTRKFNIEYLGWINTTKELKNFDISVCMSYHEGLPRIVLESLYIGLYTISNNLPGLRNIFDEHDNGILIRENNLLEFHNAITNFVEIENITNKIQYSRQKVTDNFSTETIVEEFIKVYKIL